MSDLGKRENSKIGGLGLALQLYSYGWDACEPADVPSHQSGSGARCVTGSRHTSF